MSAHARDTDAVLRAIDALHHAYDIAKGDRLAELNGTYHKRYDARGVCPFSAEVGRIELLTEICPLLSELDFRPRLIKDAAAEDALEQFLTDLPVAA